MIQQISFKKSRRLISVSLAIVLVSLRPLRCVAFLPLPFAISPVRRIAVGQPALASITQTVKEDLGGWLFQKCYGGVEEEAFLECVTVDCKVTDRKSEALRIFQRWGVVRIPNVLDAVEVSELLSEGKERGVKRNAYGQTSRSDRYTQWLGSDGIENEPDFRGQGPRTKAVLGEDGNLSECSQRPLWKLNLDSIFHSGASSFGKPVWRQVANDLGWSQVGLAEIVVSQPGGAAQDWHFDGIGVTLQVALIDINQDQGPTEVIPRPLPSEYVSCMVDDGASMTDRLASNVFHRPGYDIVTILLVTLWGILRPILDVSRARFLIEHIGLPPPVVRLLAPLGVATLYDAAMVHRGGQNHAALDRPILAVHLRGSGVYGPA